MSRDKRNFNALPAGSSESRPALSIRRSLKAEESFNMMEIMQGDLGMHRQPELQKKRVHKLGRTISERGELCQWFEPMLNSDEVGSMYSTSNQSRDSRGSNTPVSNRSFGSSSIDLTTNATHAPAETETGHKIAQDLDKETKKTCFPNEAELNRQTEVSRQEEESDGQSYEEQLNLIRQQQLQLIEQERAIQVKLREQKIDQNVYQQSGIIQECVKQLNQTEANSMKVHPSTASSVNTSVGDGRRRRLKGSQANHYARRDEGTIGSLLWYGSGEDVVPPSVSELSNDTSNNGGRQANLKQEDSASIAQLLSQTRFVENRLAGESESNETCTAVNGCK